MNNTFMQVAPFDGVPAAPPGVTLEQFKIYVEETKAMLAQRYPGAEFSHDMLAAVIKARAQKELNDARAAEAARLREQSRSTDVSEEELAGEGIIHDDDVINDSLQNGFEAQDWRDAEEQEVTEHERVKRLRLSNPLFAVQGRFGNMDVQFKLVDRLSENIEILVEVCHYLEPRDITTLYSVSRRFKETLDTNITSSIRMWVRMRAEESSEIFSFRLYRKMCMPDPAGRTNSFGTMPPNAPDSDQNAVRFVPTLRWYEMVVLRENCVDDIIEVLEDHGHRMPYGMERTLKKMWLLMDVATNQGRRNMLRNRALWTTDDLYHAQMFFIKLSMYFSDPIWPDRGTTTMPALMLGQRGLWKLWQMLTGRAFKTLKEYEQLKVRYDYIPTQRQFRLSMFGELLHGVHPSEVGTVHLEGWGRGTGHLLRPDESIRIEATNRGFDIDKHTIYMVVWGRFDYPVSEVVDIELDDESFDDPCLMDPAEVESEIWRNLHPCEKSDVMKEHITIESSDRAYLERIQLAVSQHLSYSNAAGMPPRAASQTVAAVDPVDGIDFSALPDPTNVPQRIATLDALYATAALRNDHEEPTITPAIQAAIDQAKTTVHRDVDLHDYVNRKLFGPVGIPVSTELMDKSDQAWVDYEQDDEDRAWTEYVEWINIPGDSEDEDDFEF